MRLRRLKITHVTAHTRNGLVTGVHVRLHVSKAKEKKPGPSFGTREMEEKSATLKMPLALEYAMKAVVLWIASGRIGASGRHVQKCLHPSHSSKMHSGASKLSTSALSAADGPALGKPRCHESATSCQSRTKSLPTKKRTSRPCKMKSRA